MLAVEPAAIVGQITLLSPYSLERPTSTSVLAVHVRLMPLDCSLVTMAADCTAWSSSTTSITVGSPSGSPSTSRHFGNRPSTSRPEIVQPSSEKRTSLASASTCTEPSPAARLATSDTKRPGRTVCDASTASSLSVSTHASLRPSVPTQCCCEPSAVGSTSSITPPSAYRLLSLSVA